MKIYSYRSGLNIYIAKYPNGVFIKQAKEELCFQKAKNGYMINYEDYYKSYPSGKYIEEAKLKLEGYYFTAAENYFNKNEMENAKIYYNKYLGIFPSGFKSSTAKERIVKIELIQAQVEAKKKIDEINRLNLLADKLRKEAGTECFKETMFFIGTLGTLGLGGYLISTAEADYQTAFGIITLAGGTSVCVGYTIVHNMFRKEKIKQSKSYRKQAKAITFNFYPTIDPIFNNYGLSFNIKF